MCILSHSKANYEVLYKICLELHKGVIALHSLDMNASRSHGKGINDYYSCSVPIFTVHTVTPLNLKQILIKHLRFCPLNLLPPDEYLLR